MNTAPRSIESASTLLIVAGAHESPAIAGDPEVELMLDDITTLPPGERCVVWLGGKSPADSALVPDACLEVRHAPAQLSALRESRPAWNQRSLTVLLCAPLRFHAGTWWASGVADNRVQLFDALDLIEELARGVPCCEVIVPDARLGAASPSAAPIDLPDRATLHGWRAELLARGLSCECHLGMHDIREDAPRPSRRRPLKLQPLEERLGRFADLAGAKWSSPVLILDESDGLVTWASRLALYLEALGVVVESATRDTLQTATPGTVAVLRDSALDDPALDHCLSRWSDANVAIVLLDRALAAGRDAAERWRMSPEQNRGPWRVLDQALWLGQKLVAQQPHDHVALESLRTLICEACDDFRRDSSEAWEEALPASLAWLNPSNQSTEREARLLGDDRAELLRQVSELLSAVGGFDSLCVRHSKGGHRSSAGISKLIRAWKVLQFAPDGALEGATQTLPSVYLTYSGDAALRPALSAGLTRLSRFSYEGPRPANGLCVAPEAVDFWLHVSTKPPPQAVVDSLAFAEHCGTRVIREEHGREGSECSACDGAKSSEQAVDQLMASAREELARASKQQRVFISYSVVDAPIVANLVEALEQRGVRCTRDSRSVHSGRSLEAVKKDISEHQAMLLVASKASERSDWVSAELREAAVVESGRAAYICPVDLDGSWHGFRARHSLAERPPLRMGSRTKLADTVDGIVRRLRELGLQQSTPPPAEIAANGRIQPLASHRVFVSHQFADNERDLLHRILLRCMKSGIEFWEYRTSSYSGDDWAEEIRSQIGAATHAIVLLTKDYETSTTCQEEITLLFNRYTANGASTSSPGKLAILPFLVGGREKPHAQLKALTLYHTPLEEDANEAAQKVVNALLDDLQ